MRSNIKVKFTFIRDILECTKIDKVLKILNTKEIYGTELTDILKTINCTLKLVNTVYCDELELSVSIKDNKFYIAVDGYDKFRAFRHYIHKNYNVESFTKKNHIVESELKTLTELIFHGCLPTMMDMSVSIPTASVKLFVSDSIKESIRNEVPHTIFEKFIDKYDEVNNKNKDVDKDLENQSSQYIKTLDNCTENINTFFNELNNILKRIPNHGRMAEEYILCLNMSLKKVFSDTVFVTKRYNTDIKYELNHCKFDNIFKDNKAFEYVEESQVTNFIQLLLNTNNISGLMVDEYNKLIMPVGNKLIAELQIAITNIIELIKVIERNVKQINQGPRDVELVTINTDIKFIDSKIRAFIRMNGYIDDNTKFRNLVTNYAIDLVDEYNKTHGTDFVIDYDCKAISHEAQILAPIVDKFANAVRDFDFNTIDKCVTELPAGYKFTSDKTNNKVIIKYGRGVLE